MKRRRFFKTLAAVPAGSALLAQQPAPTQSTTTQSGPGVPLNTAVGTQPPGRAASEDLPKLEPTVADGAADALPRFFSGAQFAALQKLSDLIMPAMSGSPGALAAGAPEFLDFLIGDSDSDRQRIYRAGLDGLNTEAKKQFNKAFGELDTRQAGGLLSPLTQPWTFEEPADPVARFLRVAKIDIRTATLNSREAGAGRRFQGSGLYWYPLD
jgi:hypothetical protein